MISIDGAYGEGGGQVIRTSVALAAITGQAIEIHDIRGGRAKPGLQAQHLMSVKAAARLCGATLSGAELQSRHLVFEPQMPVAAGHYRFDIGTAGSCTLVLQTILVPLALAEGDSTVVVTGGTHNPMAPCVDYLEEVFLPAVARMGLRATLEVPAYGFFPKGGGEVRCHISGGGELTGASFASRDEVGSLLARAIVSGLPEHVGLRGAGHLESRIGQRAEICKRPSRGPGAAAFVAVRHRSAFAGFTGLGERGKPMERVVEDAADAYDAWVATEATVDEHLADQLVLPAVFAQGESVWRTDMVTEHLRTVAWLTGRFVDRPVNVSPDGWVTVPATESGP